MLQQAFDYMAKTLLVSCLFQVILCNASPIIPLGSTSIHQPFITPAAPNLDAKSYILMDANSGKILAEKNADQHLAPASLTKLMSLYVISYALQNGTIRPDDKVRVSNKAWHTTGSRMFIKAGEEVPVKDLMAGIIVASGNDASVALAEYLAGTETAFAEVMNAEAKTLGMNNSHFVDSTGLPNPGHYTTARDLALLAQALTKNFPEDYRLFSEKWFTYHGIRQPNRNRLLWRFPFADGLKTGHTDEAGFCLVGSALKNNMRLISVIMGSNSDLARTEDSIRLLTYGYRFFETQKLYTANSTLTEARVWKGKSKHIKLGLAAEWFATLPSGQYKNIKRVFELKEPLNAPIVKGQSCGNLNLVLNGQVVASQPLIALSDDPVGGFFRRIADNASFHYHKLFPTFTENMNNS